MDIPLLEVLNKLSPLAVIALLALVLLYQARNAKSSDSTIREINTIKGNHLHELPQIADGIRVMNATLQRIEVGQVENFEYIKARLDFGERKRN